MITPDTLAAFNAPIACHAEIDLPAWLGQLTGKSGWRLHDEEEFESWDTYTFRCGHEQAQVALFHTGYATVDVGDDTLFDGSLLEAPGCARLHYYNAESGEPISVH